MNLWNNSLCGSPWPNCEVVEVCTVYCSLHGSVAMCESGGSIGHSLAIAVVSEVSADSYYFAADGHLGLCLRVPWKLHEHLSF